MRFFLKFFFTAAAFANLGKSSATLRPEINNLDPNLVTNPNGMVTKSIVNAGRRPLDG